jgi:hypothetical protein
MKSLPSFFPKTKLSFENISIIVIFFLGILLRLRQYLTGRSLWVDEAMLALNIVNRDFAGLFQPLDYDQGAPVGFLLVEKVFNLLFGRNEFALRLFPLLLGLLSLWMFYLLLKRFLSGAGLIVALALFAINPRLIYYSSEVKQYIADVVVTIVLLLIAIKVFDQPTRKMFGILAIAGLLALWFSHPSILLLAGVGTTLFIFHFQKRDFASLGLVAGMGVLWLLNLGLLYTLTLSDLSRNLYMREYWQGAFAPMPPWSDWNWYWVSFQKNMDTHFAITYAAWMALVILLAGCFLLFKQKRILAITLAWIFLFTLLASSLAMYPSLERMVLFLTPIVLLLLGTLLGFLEQNLRTRPVFSTFVILLISGYFFLGVIPQTWEQFISPKYFEHVRPSMEYLQAEWRDGDSMYVTNGGVPAFEYYAPIHELEGVSYTSSNRDDYEYPNAILEQIGSLEGNNRVWVLMSHVYEKGNFNERDFLLDYLKQHGTKKREFREPGTSVYLYLYDLSE